jgi:hypothetical protein
MSKYKWVCPHLDGFPGICFVSDRKQGVLLPAELVQMMVVVESPQQAARERRIPDQIGGIFRPLV